MSKQTRIWLAVLVVVTVAGVATAIDPATTQTATAEAVRERIVEAVKERIIGKWAYYDGAVGNSFVLSFDAEGRITEMRYAIGKGFLGDDEPRRGRIRYRLEPTKDGSRVLIVKINGMGEESPLYVIEGFDRHGARMAMRAVNAKTGDPVGETLLWDRGSAEPYKVEGENPIGAQGSLQNSEVHADRHLAHEPFAARLAQGTVGESEYRDRNGYFEFTPPDGWVKKEFDDPRSKVSFDVPAPVAGQNKAGLFFLSHPLTHEVNVRAEAEDRVARLKQMGSPDARVTTIDFAGVKAEQVDGQMGRQNAYLRALMFTNFGRSYTISFTATKQDFAQYWPIAEEALKTFKCLPPEGTETAADKDAVQEQKIRVWITALKEADLGTDASNSLLAIGQPAIRQLEEAERSGTPLQKQRATELLKQIRAQGQ